MPLNTVIPVTSFRTGFRALAVCLSTGGGSASVNDGMPTPRTRHPPGPDTPSQQEQTPHRSRYLRRSRPPPERRLLLRTVRILLECILVYIYWIERDVASIGFLGIQFTVYIKATTAVTKIKEKSLSLSLSPHYKWTLKQWSKENIKKKSENRKIIVKYVWKVHHIWNTEAINIILILDVRVHSHLRFSQLFHKP